jgi:hypothetical protein
VLVGGRRDRSSGAGACNASAVSTLVGFGTVQLGRATRSRQIAVTMSCVQGQLCWNRTMVWPPVRAIRVGTAMATTRGVARGKGDNGNDQAATEHPRV